MKQRTCDELGVCQARAECHVACSPPAQKHYPFAPGVIEGMRTRRVEAISRAVLVLACLAALVAVVGFAAGYFNLQGLLT